MATLTDKTPTAVAYARSLLELANESQQAEAIGRELTDLREILDSQPTFNDFLADPGISATDRTQALERLFRGKVSPLMMNFLGLLNSKRRLGILHGITHAYEDLLDEQLGKIEVDVTVAQRLSPDQLEQVRQRVSQALGKTAVIHQYVDESIIGGLILRVEDRMINASVKYQLEAMRQQLLASRSK
jgi:F-type H+-transporting ATPase subunit delta